MNKRIIDPLLKSRGFVKDRKTQIRRKTGPGYIYGQWH